MTGSAPQRRRGLPFGLAGMLFVDAGIVLLFAAFDAVNWYSLPRFGTLDFHQLHTLTAHGVGARAPRWYFSWLGWVLLASAALFGLVATIRSPLAIAFRIGGVLVSLIAIGATYWSLHKLVTPASVFDNTCAGMWLTFAGFVLTGVGAALGPLGSRSATISE